MEYFKGDRIKYTGNSKMLYGAMAYEFEYMEGHKLGVLGWTYTAPLQEAPA